MSDSDFLYLLYRILKIKFMGYRQVYMGRVEILGKSTEWKIQSMNCNVIEIL